MATPPTERPRYELIEATFADGTVANFDRSPFVAEFIPVKKHFAALRCFHRREAYQEPFTLPQVTREFSRPRKLAEIRYSIALGGKRAHFVHKFTAAAPATLSGDAIRGPRLFTTRPASVVMGAKRFGSRPIVQFSD